MTADATLDVAGTQPTSTDIPLCAGWNLIGYPLDEAQPVAEALASIDGKYDLVFAYDPTDTADPWEVYEVGKPAWSNDLQVMQAGRGFWVHATEDVTLTIAKAEPTATPTPTPTPTATATLPPAVGDPPTAEISSPADGSEVTDFVDIVGTADDPDGDLVEYRLQYRQVGTNGTALRAQQKLKAMGLLQEDAEWTTFATGNAPVVNDVLGTLDPTLLLNGMFEIRLLAVDSEGQQTIASLHLVISGQQKIGHFTLSFTDLALPVAGLDITVVRNYDSRDKRVGDFGVGWTMQLTSVELAESGVAGEDWEETTTGGFVPTYCIQPTQLHMVTVRFPNDEVHRFAPRITPQCQGLVPIQFAKVEYMALPGTTSSLQPMAGNDVVILGSPGGPVELRDLDLNLYDPRSYTLTTRDGTSFMVDEFAGVQRITDRNGNDLTITPHDITHSTGKSVAFQRDGLGRITRITDPMGNFLTYTYDANGDLVQVTDPEGNATTFTYATDHYLISASNAQGDIPLQMQYDADGRLISQTDAFGNTTTYQHDMANRREITTDRRGYATAYEYDARGNVTGITDPLGNVTSNTYDSQDNLTSTTDALGHTTAWTYDAQGNMTSVTDPLGNTKNYTYNQFGQVLTTTDALGQTITNTYDDRGNRTAITNPLGETTAFAYDAQGNMTTVVDAAGNTTSIAYDSFGNPVRQVDALGHQTTFTYDANGNPLTTAMAVTTIAGTEVISITSTYNALGQLTKRTDPDGNSEEIAYNSLGQPDVVTDQNGDTFVNQYDAMGRRIGLTLPDGMNLSNTYDPEGNTVAKTDLAGKVVNLAHDPLGRITQVAAPDGTTTTVTYDAVGQQTGFTDENGHTLDISYDEAGRQTQVNQAGAVIQYGYDAVGNLTSMTDANGNVTTFEYNAAGRVTRIVYPDGSAVSMTYDALGRKTSETDPLGNTTYFAYDALSRLTEVRDALGGVTRYGYDERGNLVSITDALGRTTRMGYGRMGRLVRRTLPSGDFETFAYDARGRKVSHTDFNGQTITFTYDARDRMTSKTLPDGSTIGYTYTAGGQIASITDSSGTTTFAYDDRQRLTQVTYPDGATIVYTYDATGNLASRTTASGTVSYTYDAQDRLTTVTAPDGGVTTYTYDGAGKVTSVTYPNGAATAYSYDSMNRLTELVNRKSDGTVLSSYRYTYDAVGNRTSVEELDGTTIAYTYDALYRLTQEVKTAPDGGTVYDIHYTYDAVGNRLTSDVVTTSAQSTNGGGTTTYTYDINDRLLEETQAAGDHITYTYALNGNLLTKTDGSGTSTFAYDAENQMIRATTASDVIEYLDNGLGLRTGKVVNGSETRYLVDTTPAFSQVLEERDGTGAVTSSYVLGHGQISMERGGATSYYHYDGLGSVRQLSDGAQNITDSYEAEGRSNGGMAGRYEHGTGPHGGELAGVLAAGEAARDSMNPRIRCYMPKKNTDHPDFTDHAPVPAGQSAHPSDPRSEAGGTTMIKLTTALTLGILLVLVTGSAGLAGSPPLPASFYGTVRLDGVNVPAGTLVSAWINGAKYAEASTTLADGGAVYLLDVPGDDPDTPEIEGGRDGENITFQIAGFDATPATLWFGGSHDELNLQVITGPDLVVTQVGVENMTTDPQTLIAGGVVTATIANHGNIGVPSGVAFAVTFFEDRNGNARYDPAVDNTLGQATHATGLDAGAEVELTAAVAGQVLFRDNLVYALVDSGDAVAELNEDNNLNHSGSRCEVRPPVGQFNPQLEWYWPDERSAIPFSAAEVLMAPAVADITADGIPDIILVRNNYITHGGNPPGYLHAVNGRDGTDIPLPGTAGQYVGGAGTPAVGDIDHDGRPEIVSTKDGYVYVFEHDGTFKWQSTQYWGHDLLWSPAIADIDRDGTPPRR